MRRRATPIIILLLLLGGGALAYVGGLRLPAYLVPGDAPRVTSPKTPAAPPGSAKSPQAGALEALAPGLAGDGQAKFDIARIDPKGVSVFAGRAAPNALVTVLGDGKPVASVKADENGEWAVSAEYKFTTANPKLTLEARAGGEAVVAAKAPAGARPPSAREAAAPGTVTARLMENLEELVESARQDAARPKANAPAGATGAKTVPGAGQSRPVLAEAPPANLGSSRVQPAPVRADSIPIPITFVYREAAFTDDGRRAATLLLEYLELKKLPTISLSGHADEIGGPVYNMALSKERLDAVARFLREGGYMGQLDLVPRGESEPFTGIDRTRMAEDEVRQLDRRVELRLTN